MRYGLFAMNVTGGLVMTKSPRWFPSFSLISEKLNYVESQLSSNYEFAFVPICRWKGYSGEKDIAGDSIESIALSSYLLSKTKFIKIFGTFSTFAYEPELVGHAAARLNFEFENRFALNIVGGWKKDEYLYFKKPFLNSPKLVYDFASEWAERFREAEASHFCTFSEILQLKSKFKKSEVICAAFSAEGRNFASKYADSLFTTITKTQINDDSNFALSSALSLFIRDNLEDSKNYYNDLLGKNADNISANNFCNQLKESNPIKSFLNKKNINLVKSGAGIEELITDMEGLIEFIKLAKKSRIKTLLFALPDYDKSLDLLLSAISQIED